MNKIHDVDRVAFTDDEMLIAVDGTEHRFLLIELSPKLAGADAVERERFEITPSGYGIHWPLLDEDLSIDGILGIKHTPSFSSKQAA
jgi:hypothetical protein